MGVLAARVDITIEEGATFECPFSWLDSSGNPHDISGWDIRMKIRPTKQSATVLAEGSYDGGTDTPSGVIVISEDGAGGTITIYMSPTNTAALDFTTAWYDLELEDGDADVYRIAEGKVTLSREATR